MVAYISGAVTGIPDDNKQAFNDACSQVKEIAKKHGVEITVINPIEIAVKVRAQFSEEKKSKPEWPDYMRACIKKLCESDVVYFLPGWAQSRGATLERHIAQRLDIRCAEDKDLFERILKNFY